MLDDLMSVVIQTCAKAGEGFKLLELRVGELEIARDGTISRPLRRAADA